MQTRESLFDSGLTNTVVFGAAIAGSAIVVAVTRHQLSPAASTIVGAAALVPSFLLAFFVAYFIDRARRSPQVQSTHGVTWSGVFYAEALFLAAAPMIDGEDRGIDWGVAFVAWILAAGCVFAGRAAKRRKRAREDMARLAQINVNLATRFMVRPDKKGWPEIEPFTVVAYQRAFEKALAAVGEPLPGQSVGVTSEQAARLIKAVEDGDVRFRFPEREDRGPFNLGPKYYPGPVVALVLAYLDAPPEVKSRDRAEWAAAVATRVNASEIRDCYTSHAAALFEKHAKYYS